MLLVLLLLFLVIPMYGMLGFTNSEVVGFPNNTFGQWQVTRHHPDLCSYLHLCGCVRVRGSVCVTYVRSYVGIGLCVCR